MAGNFYKSNLIVNTVFTVTIDVVLYCSRSFSFILTFKFLDFRFSTG